VLKDTERKLPAEFSKARDYAFLLLKFRLRSEDELYQRLRKKKFSEEASRSVVAFLKEKKFLDDAEFARLWISSRIKKPLGLRRLKFELKLKGVDKGIIEAQARKACRDYNEGEVANTLARTKMNTLKDLEPLKAKRRVFAFLMRRGFSAEAAGDALSRL